MHGQMPLISFDAGALFTLPTDVFNVRQRPEQLNAADEYSNYDFVPYFIKAVFEKPTQYLAIPFKIIRNIAAGLNISTSTGIR